MTRFVTVIAAAAVAVELASAFAPAFIGGGGTTQHHATPIYLVPEQGRQLVAFSQDYLSKKAKESASKASNLTSPRRRHTESSTKGMTSAARTLVTRLLGDEEKTSLRSVSIEDELNPIHQRSEDEVIYPIVGFNLVDGHAVPMPEQQASCNLHLQKKGEEEEFGYWSSPQGADSLWM